VVDVERLSVRYQADHVWLITNRSNDQHLLSCCLNLSWPAPELRVNPSSIEGADETLKALGEVVDELLVRSRATSSRATVVDGRFTGWLSYPNVDRAAAAFGKLRELLHARGLSVNQWSRDLIIPRQSR
jgi:hypothetical protein